MSNVGALGIMKRKAKATPKRDLEAERNALLEIMSRYISTQTQRKIDAAIEAMNKAAEYTITVSHTGAGHADDK